MISENFTETDIIIHMDGLPSAVSAVHQLLQLSVEGKRSRGSVSFCCNYKQHDHRDHGGEEDMEWLGTQVCLLSQ